ncbi:MAG TPA: 23S rRNA (adenine(2503)-C(2))-methyltransferase RlmN [Gammaproteobacteria bacterium]|nr:23S rRNA (adenine(2503)-C(2))-methyltransferase RlmN [Gammaproteobacteria bacterium]
MNDGARPLLLDLELADLPCEAGRAYRRDQLAGWVYARGAHAFDDMTDLPKRWREELEGSWRLDPFDEVQRYPSWDDSVRYLFVLPDGRRTEAVYMPYEHRKTVCVSSMVGCPAGCTFCATGALGFGRNLSRGEIVGQLLAVAWHEGIAPSEIRNVVLMGMGEALLNYDEAIAAVRRMIEPGALDMSPRRITLSTVGLPKRIERLAEEGLQLTLAVSLHAPDEATRREIIPTAHAHSIDDIVRSLHVWQERTGRRVTIEYTMLAGVNDALWQADELARLLRGLSSHVNLIPFNDWSGAGMRGTSRDGIEAFRARLEARGASVSVRFSRGQDTGGACGQLSLQESDVPRPSGSSA